MKMILNLIKKCSITISTYTFLLLILQDLLFIEKTDDNTIMYRCLEIGILGFSIMFVKAAEHIFDDFMKQLLIEQDPFEDRVKLAQLGEVYFFLGIFCLYALTGYSVMVAIKGSDWIDTFDLLSYLGIMSFGLIMYLIYKKWNYPNALNHYKNVKC